jgi:hypothetical protein
MARQPAPQSGLPLPQRCMLRRRRDDEVDGSTLPHPRTPHLMTDARCPFCGGPHVLGGYFEVLELAPVEVPRPREKKPQR